MSLRKTPELTPELLEAARRNAQQATGPRTAAGKENVKMNAVKHGMYSADENHQLTMLALGEDPQEFEALEQELLTTYGPGDALWRRQIEDLAKLYWRRQRLERVAQTLVFQRVCGSCCQKQPVNGQNTIRAGRPAQPPAVISHTRPRPILHSFHGARVHRAEMNIFQVIIIFPTLRTTRSKKRGCPTASPALFCQHWREGSRSPEEPQSLKGRDSGASRFSFALGFAADFCTPAEAHEKQVAQSLVLQRLCGSSSQCTFVATMQNHGRRVSLFETLRLFVCCLRCLVLSDRFFSVTRRKS